MRNRLRAAGALLACLLLLVVGGCATVPEESQARVISSGGMATPAPPNPEPDKDLDALGVVREFVSASAQPNNDHNRARLFLDPPSRSTWRPDRGLTVMEEKFDTVYSPNQPEDPNRRVVLLRGTNVGKLGPDSAFIPLRDSFERPVHLARQPDGQWRIVSPANDIVITEPDFTRNYFRVPVYFFATDRNSLVPDLRYVVQKPQSGLPGRVIDLLLAGPSDFLDGAVNNPLGQASIDQNVSNAADGAVVVPLTGVSEQSDEQKRLIVAQVVLSLQSVTSSRIRLLSDGAPLVPGREEWRASDLPSYETSSSPASDLPGLMISGGRVRSLSDGAPVPGPAGSRAYDVVTAAQSVDGKQLAVIERQDGRLWLRVGEFGSELARTELNGDRLSRPTWRPALTGTGEGGELWTVVDGSQVVRVLRTAQGTWASQVVNADSVRSVGPDISAIRLSRDGTRAAMVVTGRLVVVSVVRTADSVSLRSPRVLQETRLSDVTDVDWANQDSLVAITGSTALPVVRVPVDGLRLDQFNLSNLTPPLHAITAAPSRPVVVADREGLWTASEVGEVWTPHDHSLPLDTIPFYPG
ncbi:LpqB family beta-propeller domain-containing protein [Saccharothrix sp. AJ9571]|nr:LpqB family beta-propeller domain-containing protein [Saccharothrix sp. AJ9571]